MAKMATTKQFLDWNNKFSKAEITKCRRDWFLGNYHNDDAALTDSWKYTVFSWTNEQIHQAVYLASDAEEWQLFRVSLKGLTTREKLFLLLQRMERKVVGINQGMFVNRMDYMAARDKEQCRIDNYIGALVRGGQLSKTYEVVR